MTAILGVIAGPRALDAVTQSCASLASGGSLATALAGSEGGCTVTAAPGSYGSQFVGNIVKSPPVIVEAEGAVFTSLSLGTNTQRGPTGLEIRKATVSSLGIRYAENVTMRDTSGGLFNLISNKNVSLIGGEFGPWTNGVNHVNVCNVAGSCLDPTVVDEGTLIDGVWIHDYLINDPAPHAECLQLLSTGGTLRGLTIRNSIFQNCTDFGLFSKDNLTDVVIENNFFDEPMPGNLATAGCSPGCPRSGNSISFNASGTTPRKLTNVTVRYNSALGGIQVAGALTNGEVKGNLAKKAAGSFFCTAGVQFSFNIWSANTGCGPGDKMVANYWAQWVDGDPSNGLMDFRLTAAAAAIDAADPTSFPAKDIDGKTRPIGGAPDVGASEFGQSEPPPTTTTETTEPPPPTETEPPPMTTYMDDFDRSTLGPNWTKHFGDVGIIGGSDLGLLGPSAFALLSWATPLAADQSSKAVVTAGVDPSVSKGVFVRRRASDGARYQFHYDNNGTDADPRPQWQLKYDGVPTAQTRILAVDATTPEPMPPYEIRVTAQDSDPVVVRGYLNGQLLLEAADATASRILAGAAGVALLKVGGVTTPIPIFEHWAGGELAAVPPPPEDDRAIFCGEFVPAIQAAAYYGKWSAQNPGELAQWAAYRDAVCAGQSPVPPVFATFFGRALVAAGKEAT